MTANTWVVARRGALLEDLFETRTAAVDWLTDLWGPETPETFAISRVQLAALIAYKDARGRFWKSQLSREWERSDYGNNPHSAELQQLRNQLGPRWLYRQRLVR